MGKRAAETFYRVFLSSYTAHQSYSAQIRQLHTAVSDQTRTVSMAENSPSVSGTCLGAPSFPRRKARSCTLESISTERLLTVQHATVQQIRLAAYLHTWQDLNLTTTFISMSLFLAYPTSCLKTFSPGSTSRDNCSFLPHCESISFCTPAQEGGPWQQPSLEAAKPRLLVLSLPCHHLKGKSRGDSLPCAPPPRLSILVVSPQSSVQHHPASLSSLHLCANATLYWQIQVSQVSPLPYSQYYCRVATLQSQPSEPLANVSLV